MSKIDYNIINDLFYKMKYKKTLEKIEELMKYYPDDYIIKEIKIKTLSILGRFDEAKSLIKNSNFYGEYKFLYQGLLEENMDNIEEAKRLYRKSIFVRDNIKSHMYLASLFEKEGNLKAAESEYDIIEKSNGRVTGLLGKGRIAVRMNDTGLAEQYFKDILCIEDKKDYGLKNLLGLAIYNEDYEKAYDYLCMLPISSQQRLEKKAKMEEFFVKYKLGMIPEKYLKEHNEYIERQIYDYSEDLFYSEYMNNLFYMNTSGYRMIISDINELSDIIKDAKITISKKTPISYGFKNKYVVKYSKPVGQSVFTNNETKTLLVTTISGTKNIVSVYSVPDYYDSYQENKKEIDEYHSPIQRTRKSQIDKFNQRYSIK